MIFDLILGSREPSGRLLVDLHAHADDFKAAITNILFCGLSFKAQTFGVVGLKVESYDLHLLSCVFPCFPSRLS